MMNWTAAKLGLNTYFSGTGNEPPPSAYPLECNTFPPWIPMLAHHHQIVSSTLEQRVITRSWDLGNPTQTCSNQAELNRTSTTLEHK